jgi:hypothetical protein
VQGLANGLHARILGAVIIAGGDNVAVKLAADFNAIFHDGGLDAYLYATIFDHFNAINDLNFLKHDALLV